MYAPTSIELKCRFALIDDYLTARQYCAEKMLAARIAIADNQILQAVSLYQLAQEAAEILLDTDSDNAKAERRYLKCCIELGYLFRNLNHYKSLISMVRKVQLRLRRMNLHYNENDMLSALNYVVDCDDNIASNWLQQIQQPVASSVNLSQAHTANSATASAATSITLYALP
jgi:hypothetical protein